METPENNLITVQTYKEITRLYKAFLELVEDLKNEHQIMLEKIKSNSPKENSSTVDSADYFTQEKYDQVRKRVLDHGNETARQIISFLDLYDFQINSRKLDILASQRKVVKKFTTSMPTFTKEIE